MYERTKFYYILWQPNTAKNGLAKPFLSKYKPRDIFNSKIAIDVAMRFARILYRNKVGVAH